MSGEKDLKLLLQHMRPELNAGTYVFCLCTKEELDQLAFREVLFCFREEEGTTAVVHKHIADAAGLKYSYICAWITLRVYSSLAAVGLTAAFSTALAQAGISCNVVAAYHHDHLFVPVQDAAQAMQVLSSLSS